MPTLINRRQKAPTHINLSAPRDCSVLHPVAGAHIKPINGMKVPSSITKSRAWESTSWIEVEPSILRISWSHPTRVVRLTFASKIAAQETILHFELHKYQCHGSHNLYPTDQKVYKLNDGFAVYIGGWPYDINALHIAKCIEENPHMPMAINTSIPQGSLFDGSTPEAAHQRLTTLLKSLGSNTELEQSLGKGYDRSSILALSPRGMSAAEFKTNIMRLSYDQVVVDIEDSEAWLQRKCATAVEDRLARLSIGRSLDLPRSRPTTLRM